MEPPKGFWASLCNFIRFLPFFIGLLLLGNIKGIIFCPLICLIITIGNSAIIVGLWAAHSFWTYYCVVRAKQLGPVLKLVICICVLPVLLIWWPVVGIVGSIVGGAAYGFLSPIFATFDAVGEGKTNPFYHCVIDGTWSTIKGSLTVVMDVRDMCFHSYFSIMDDLRQKEPPEVKYYEIRLFYLPLAVIVGVLGIIVDMSVISFIALFKGPYMLFKGWKRLFHDLIGREGPFLETICVPFAGLAILLWPLAVVGAVLASMIASIFLGAYAGAVAYQESSFLFGIRYIVAALSLYDEYSNDIVGMPEGSCFPRFHSAPLIYCCDRSIILFQCAFTSLIFDRPQYRRKAESLQSTSLAPSFTSSFKRAPSRSSSLKNTISELKPLELLDGLFKECRNIGETKVAEGLITCQDIEEAKSGKGSRVISVGLPAYCLLQGLLRSAESNSTGILTSDGTELTTTNRPTEKFFDWFFHPLLIIKDQIKAENLSASEEDYLCKLVLLGGDLVRLKNSNIGPAPESERKRAELDALARRLQGITKSMSRFPTFKRRLDHLVKTLSDYFAEKHGAQITSSKSSFARMISLNSFKGKRTTNGSDQESEHSVRDVEISC